MKPALSGITGAVRPAGRCREDRSAGAEAPIATAAPRTGDPAAPGAREPWPDSAGPSRGWHADEPVRPELSRVPVTAAPAWPCSPPGRLARVAASPRFNIRHL